MKHTVEDNHCAIMKKFFVKKEYRSQKVGLALYKKLLEFAEAANVQYIILDTPSVAHASHRFYEKAGQRQHFIYVGLRRKSEYDRMRKTAGVMWG